MLRGRDVPATSVLLAAARGPSGLVGEWRAEKLTIDDRRVPPAGDRRRRWSSDDADRDLQCRLDGDAPSCAGALDAEDERRGLARVGAVRGREEPEWCASVCAHRRAASFPAALIHVAQGLEPGALHGVDVGLAATI